MINLSLGRHDFLNAVEGFARGSPLRQHVWQEIVYKSIPQMSDDDMDFLWFYMRRDIFKQYFYELNGKKNTHVGYEDFMHALAALHRGNRYKITFRSEADNALHNALCYRFDGDDGPWGAWCCNIEGIPLTSEFLEKNGFKEEQHQKDGTSEWYDYYHYDLGINIVYEVEENKFAAYLDGKKLREIEYAHELQHILWALGLNEELKV